MLTETRPERGQRLAGWKKTDDWMLKPRLEDLPVEDLRDRVRYSGFCKFGRGVGVCDCAHLTRGRQETRRPGPLSSSGASSLGSRFKTIARGAFWGARPPKKRHPACFCSCTNACVHAVGYSRYVREGNSRAIHAPRTSNEGSQPHGS